MKAELLCTIEKFPGLKKQISSLYYGNEEFQALCHDYFLCVKSLGQWEMSVEKDEKFLQGYKELKATLENELLQFIGHSEKKNNRDLS